jgi:hypothetical protein
MPAINTYNKADMAQLAYAQKDPLANLGYNQAFPAMAVPEETGQFREVDARTYYLEPETKASKFTVPKSTGFGDSMRTYETKPVASSFEFSEADLAQPRAYGYASRADLIRSRLEWKAGQMKKVKEKALWTIVNTDATFEGATYYADASVAWDTVGTSDPAGDVGAGKLIVPQINAGIMSYTAFVWCQMSTNIKALTNVSGPKRDGAVDPTITPEFLKNVFQLDYLWIVKGDFITASSDPTDETRAEIWGNQMLLFYFNPGDATDPQRPSFIKHLVWDAPGSASGEHWLVNETLDPEPGGLGVRKWGIWNYFQFLVHEPMLAYRVDALYS